MIYRSVLIIDLAILFPTTFSPCFKPPNFKPFYFNVPCQCTLLKFMSNFLFRFNALWLAAVDNADLYPCEPG